MLESKLHIENCFITLTYNDENLPPSNSLKKRDVQLFIKRLRKKVAPLKIRYFLAGEYGGRKGRPHYHMILFGYIPDDLRYLKHTNKKEIIYTSKMLEKLWGNGFISIGTNMTLNSLKYVAKYLSKLSDYNPIKQAPPFSTQSNRPGIGAHAFDTSIYETDGIYLEGRKWPIPRYFDKLAEYSGFDLTTIKEKRDLKVKSYANTFPTLNEKREYNITMEKQGYDSKHLFIPSHKKLLSHFLAFDNDGVADIPYYKNELKNYLLWHHNSFFDTFPFEKTKNILKYKQLTIYDYNLKLY